jgi:S1-C subfamily serine protease
MACRFFKKASWFVFLLLMALPVLGAPDWGTLFKGIVKVVAEKRGAPDTGAGIVIAASADSIRILTAAHVVSEATGLRVYFYSDRAVAFAGHLLPGSSDLLDLAVLEVRPAGGRALPGNISKLNVRNRTLALGDHIWTVDSGWRIVPNNVAALDHDTNTQLFEYTKGAVTDGFSGGGVFDDEGRLAGVHRGGAEGGQYAVAAKVEAALEVLGALGHNTPNLSRGAEIPSGGTPPPPKPAPQETCRISIGSTPSGADVSVDGNPSGTTPAVLDLTNGKRYDLKISKDGYKQHTQSVNCSSARVSAILLPDTGTISLRYFGDLAYCTLYLNVKIGNKTVRPISTLFQVDGVALGSQRYTISGTIACPLAGQCAASGSGNIDVKDASVYDISWRNTAIGVCTVVLTP